MDSTAGVTPGFLSRSVGGVPWRSAIIASSTFAEGPPIRSGNGCRPVSNSNRMMPSENWGTETAAVEIPYFFSSLELYPR